MYLPDVTIKRYKLIIILHTWILCISYVKFLYTIAPTTSTNHIWNWKRVIDQKMSSFSVLSETRKFEVTFLFASRAIYQRESPFPSEYYSAGNT